MPRGLERVEQDGRGVFVTVNWLGTAYRVDWDAEHRFWWQNGPVGADAYGVYAELTVKGATQRFRWMLPGEFWMGSPDDEPGRDDNEGPCHRVRLTQGFWLADTACPQVLWQAVMGDNPSHFKGADLPVDNVSWEEVQRFLRGLERQVPGLKADLPTEAEWEYACRAGTRTPFSFGSSLTTDHANYDGNHPYDGGARGENREKTLPVCCFAPNAWGSYQMHGNVWEWCADGFRAYSAGGVVDPRGPEGEGVSRVLRGGSWYDYGQSCRAAYRPGLVPGYRSHDIGFRLALRSPGPAGGRSARSA